MSQLQRVDRTNEFGVFYASLTVESHSTLSGNTFTAPHSQQDDELALIPYSLIQCYPQRRKIEPPIQDESRVGREKRLQLPTLVILGLCIPDEMVSSLPEVINDDTRQYLTDD